MLSILLLLFLISVDAENEPFVRHKRSRQKMSWIIHPAEVEPAENLIDLPEMTAATLPNFIGEDDNSAESKRKTMEFLARYSLIPNERSCPGCNTSMTLVKETTDTHFGLVWHCPPCKKANGSKKIRIRNNSFFEGMHVSVHKVLKLAANWVSNPGIPIRTVAVDEGLSAEFIGDLHQWFRELTEQWWEEKSLQGDWQLGGEGTIVEIDETMMYRAKYNRGAALLRPQIWVFGLVQRGTNKVAMMRVQRRNAATLLPLIEKHVKNKTLIVSDGWSAYGGIKALQKEYRHKFVNHKVRFVDPDDRRVHTQSIESTWGAFKRSMKSRFGDPAEKLDGHLCNYMFRRGNNRTKLLNHLMVQMSTYRRVTGKMSSSSSPRTTTPPTIIAESDSDESGTYLSDEEEDSEDNTDSNLQSGEVTDNSYDDDESSVLDEPTTVSPAKTTITPTQRPRRTAARKKITPQTTLPPLQRTTQPTTRRKHLAYAITVRPRSGSRRRTRKPSSRSRSSSFDDVIHRVTSSPRGSSRKSKAELPSRRESSTGRGASSSQSISAHPQVRRGRRPAGRGRGGERSAGRTDGRRNSMVSKTTKAPHPQKRKRPSRGGAKRARGAKTH